MSFEYGKIKREEADSFRRSAFFGITISTVATLTAIIAVPMLYNYVQYIQSSLRDELDFCKHRSDGLWHEYSIVRNFIFSTACTSCTHNYNNYAFVDGKFSKNFSLGRDGNWNPGQIKTCSQTSRV